MNIAKYVQHIRASANISWSLTHLCQLLHILLILLYAVSVVAAVNHWEHGLNYPFTSAGQTTMSVTISTVTQTFSTVGTLINCMLLNLSNCSCLQLYLAILVLVSQRLALVRDLHTRQTLTAIHDKSSAWLGLGSSIMVLKDQLKVRAAIPSVAFIALYLGGVAALHITTPASVSVGTYNGTAFIKNATRLARPNGDQ